MNRAKSVEEYIDSAVRWQAELRRLREILCTTDLEEEVKWGAPCYTIDGKNVVGMAAFKAYFALWFHQGALLSDGKNVLINAQEGKTKALRQWRMTSVSEIRASDIRRYVREAIKITREGRTIKPERSRPLVLPPELATALEGNKSAAAAYRNLRPGLQREYADYIAEAKREDTKTRRIDKILPLIIDRVGLNDKYR